MLSFHADSNSAQFQTGVLFHEDCLVGMDRIPDGSVDMILCDLPYGTTACKWDVVIPFEPLWAQYKRVIKRNGAVVLFGSEPFSSALRMSNIKQYKYDWVWKKQKPTNFYQAKFQPLKDHEMISVFCLERSLYFPQGTSRVCVKSGRKNKSSNLYSKYDGGNYVQTIGNFPRSVLEFPTEGDQYRLHPTQKPVALLEYLIRTYTNEGETVLDNCIGSGSTAVAAINTGRNWIGFEKDQKYFEIARKRIEAAYG